MSTKKHLNFLGIVKPQRGNVYLWFVFFVTLVSCVTDIDRMPLSQVAENLDMQVYWNPQHQNAYVKNNERYYIFSLQSSTVHSNDQVYTMKSPAIRERGEIFIPQQFFLRYLREQPVKKKTVEAPPRHHAKKMIILDAGHGGRDPGAVYEDIYEKDLNLQVVNFVAHALQDKYTLRFTRIADSFVALQDRVTQQQDSVLFISIHFNAAHSQKASGFEAWISTDGDEERSSKSNFLAQKLLQHIEENTPLVNRGIRWGDFHVLKNSTVPSVLLECGFMTNVNDLQWFLQIENMKRFSQSVAHAIDEYIQVYE